MGANVPPESGIRIPADELRRLVQRLFARAGMADGDAGVMAELLVATDLRGVFSHGTRAVPGYLRMILDGRVNGRPNIEVVSATTTTRVYDGDGGMGHLPSHLAAAWVAQTAAAHGVAAATTGNHFHFGAAGKYSRLAAAADCIGIAISSHRWARAGDLRTGATGGSPLSIAVPAGDQPPLVIDMGTRILHWDEALFAQWPFPYFKELGLGAVAHALGGILAGIWRPGRIPPVSRWESNQGGFFAAFQIAAFCPLDEFRAEMDRYVADCRALKPFPGLQRAQLPGGVEWENERDWGRRGIPLSDDHRDGLAEVASQLGVDTPFARFEGTRFGPPS